MRDYADACVRYLRATGLVNISHIGKSLSIVPEKIQEVDYFLQHTEREPCFIDNEGQYVAYLGNPLIPTLLTDNRELLEQKIRAEFPNYYSEKDDKLWQDYTQNHPEHFLEEPKLKKDDIWEHLDEIRKK
jgi:hypothetical protein